MDLVVEGKTLVNGSFQNCCIGIENEKIVSVKKNLKGDKHIKFSKKLILPAAIDIHVHFRDPGMSQKEDFSSGSKAAAFGGVSCVFDMPNNIPSTTTKKAVLNKIKKANKKSFVDFGFHAGLTNKNLDNIEGLAESCIGFKVYLGGSTNYFLLDKSKLKKVFDKTADFNKPVLFHAEDQGCLSRNKMIEKSLKDHQNSRPSICEVKAIKNVLDAAKNTNVKAHICHLSSFEGLKILKDKPNNISCGTTPHHCLLSAKKETPFPSFYKVNPPLRNENDKDSLFEALQKDGVDILESDHAPHTVEEKKNDFENAPSGVPGVETMFPLFLYLAIKGKISFRRLTHLLCERPAELFGLSKGKIEKGRDADFVIVDYKDSCKINSDDLHSKCGWTPFEGYPAIFPKYVFIRGEKVVEDRELIVDNGYGQSVI